MRAFFFIQINNTVFVEIQAVGSLFVFTDQKIEIRRDNAAQINIYFASKPEKLDSQMIFSTDRILFDKLISFQR